MSESDDDFEDVEEHPIDWGGIGVRSRAGGNGGENDTGLGDPTRWGSNESLTVVNDNVYVFSAQVARVQAADIYPRNWQAVGTLTLDSALYGSDADPSLPATWLAELEVTLGVGQASIVQVINLRALTALAAPYPPTATGTWYVPQQSGSRVTLAWVIPGGLVGRAISARFAAVVAPPAPPPAAPTYTFPQRFDLGIVIAPYAMGIEK